MSAAESQPQIVATPTQHRHNVLHHRPDSPCNRRQSSPETLQKMREALEEMSDRIFSKADNECGDQPYLTS